MGTFQIWTGLAPEYFNETVKSMRVKALTFLVLFDSLHQSLLREQSGRTNQDFTNLNLSLDHSAGLKVQCV